MQKLKVGLLALLFPALPITLLAQTCGFSEGKNLAELRAAVFDKNGRGQTFGVASSKLSGSFKLPESCPIAPPPLVFLPHWSAEKLPFFCKIEHDWGKKSRIPFKFRLGSVEYVDWLEGKL